VTDAPTRVEPSDERLIEAAQHGDQRALDDLLRRHYDRVYAICRRMTGNEPDALDATQDALIAITRGLPRYDGRARFTTWSYRVTTNACLDELRRRKRRPVPQDDDAFEAVPSTSPRLDQSVTDRLTIDDALAVLPDDFRAAVVLRDVIGLDYADISDVLEIPPGTVRSRIARGRRALADHIGRNQEPPGAVQVEAHD
jgi:RNA polymerase sigma-70 factor, ECF subfamily